MMFRSFLLKISLTYDPFLKVIPPLPAAKKGVRNLISIAFYFIPSPDILWGNARVINSWGHFLFISRTFPGIQCVAMQGCASFFCWCLIHHLIYQNQQAKNPEETLTCIPLHKLFCTKGGSNRKVAQILSIHIHLAILEYEGYFWGAQPPNDAYV